MERGAGQGVGQAELHLLRRGRIRKHETLADEPRRFGVNRGDVVRARAEFRHEFAHQLDGRQRRRADGAGLEEQARVAQAPAPADGVERGLFDDAVVEQRQEAPLVLERGFRSGESGLRRPGERNGPARGLAHEEGLGVRAEHDLAPARGGRGQADRARHRVLVELQQASGGGGRAREAQRDRAPPAAKVVPVPAQVGEGVRDLRTRDEGAAKRVGAGAEFLREP